VRYAVQNQELVIIEGSENQIAEVSDPARRYWSWCTSSTCPRDYGGRLLSVLGTSTWPSRTLI